MSQQVERLYDRPDQEFESEAKKRPSWAEDRLATMKGVHKRIANTTIACMRNTCALRAVPKMVDLSKWDIDEDEWMKHVEEVKNNFKSHDIAMSDISAYLYLYDLVTGRRTDYEMRYAFIDEIQDYTPFQLVTWSTTSTG